MWLKAFIVLTCANSVTAARPFFTGVGDLPGGGTSSQAYAVSADGLTVVGGSSSAASVVNESYEAFVWTVSGGIRGLGDIPGGKFSSLAVGVSGQGEVIVGRSIGPTGSNEACYWTQEGQLVVLGHLPGETRGDAYGVSADATTIVGSSGLHAFRWTQTEGMIALPDLAPTSPHTTALAASADGSVVVGHSQAYDPVTGYYTQAFRWTAEWWGGMVGLGDLPGGSVVSAAESISDDGQVIVGSSVSENGGEAFRWSISERMVGLGDLPGGLFGSQAFDVSADGSIIVGRGTSPEGNRAFVWDAVHGMRDLHDVLVGEYGLNLTGWVLDNAMSVSADGMTIVGIGRNPQGYSEGWVAHVPEPASLLLLALGGLAVMRRARRVGAIMVPAVLAVVLLSAASARANVFDMPAGLTSLEMVTVGDAGNAGELSGSGAGGVGPDRICGSVGYSYRIGKYEVTVGQYTEFLNKVAKTDPYGLYHPSMNYDDNPSSLGCNIKRSGSAGSYTYTVGNGTPDDIRNWANRPVNYVSWGDAARFANWMHNGQPTGAQDLSTTEDGAYNLSATQQYYGPDGEPPEWGTPNWEPLNAALLAVTRKSDWKWAIPTEDEWYKAAYYKGGSTNAGYWDYPTGTNDLPSNVLSDPNPDPGNNANYSTDGAAYMLGSPYYRTNVGDFENSDSPYGTFDQGGNLHEYNEAVITFVDSVRGVRGGTIDGTAHLLYAASRCSGTNPAWDTWGNVGFRVVQVPEPTSLPLLTLGGLAVMRRRR